MTTIEPGAAITQITTIAGSVMTFLTSSPLAYFFYAGLAGIAIGIIRKLKH